MAYIISISIKDERLKTALSEFKRSGGNISGLISSLLEHYFFGGGDKESVTKEVVLLHEIRKRLDEFEAWRDEIIPELQELEEKLQEKQKEEQMQREQPLIQELREKVFADLVDISSLELWDRARNIGKDPDVMIRARLSPWAVKKDLSLAEAAQLFLRAFPEFADELEGLA